ncbi:MAG: ATP phosphoribosyltransferase HisG [Candidatus Methanohalarchaeum thermophilum]|uniref:ATP phosphoribosyltransferase n=1 Tax=Methanohalarchaeum thermophilum TaxID=1903181 RepID=A0A1Q6DXY3_METT1|nr:MAG: ATP phosphoribosyltransferase HisG [Candidatus Methanohalarchaeum thermophilum]
MKIAVPNKGRVYEPTIDLLEKAGLHVLDKGKRKLFAETSDPSVELLFARTGDIPEYIQDGAAEVGITSLDFIRETEVDVEVLMDLEYGKAEMVLAAPEDSEIELTDDITDDMKIVTEFPSVSSNFFEKKGVSPEIIEVSGATEMTPQVGIADAIIDLTSTGTTLRMNRLEIIEKVMDTSVHLISNKDALEDSKEKIFEVKRALESVIRGEKKKYVMMNAPKDKLDEIKEKLPGLSGPTIMRVESNNGMKAVHVVVDESKIYKLINDLKEIGAQDILVTSIDRIVP